MENEEKLSECPECGGHLEDMSPYFRGELDNAWVECIFCGFIPEKDA